MKDFETQLNTLGKMGRDVNMTESEKSLMRSHIETFITNNPLPIQKAIPVRSPYANIFGVMSFARVTAFILVGVILGTTGVASASFQALPGDVLYPIKTGVVEPIIGTVTATTPEEKVAYEEKLVYKRLNEIKQLQNDNNLDIKRTIVAQKAIAYQSEQFNLAVSSIEPENATFAIEKNQRVSDEFKRSEDILNNNTKTTALMAVSATTITEPIPENIVTAEAMSKELKINRERLNDKRKILEATRTEKQSSSATIDTETIQDTPRDIIDKETQLLKDQKTKQEYTTDAETKSDTKDQLQKQIRETQKSTRDSSDQ